MIKGMLGALVGITLGGEVIRQIGNSNLSSGMKDATQSLVGVGVLSNTFNSFRWK